MIICYQKTNSTGYPAGGLVCGDDAVMDTDGQSQLVSLSDSEPVESVTDVICDITNTKSATSRLLCSFRPS